MNDERSAARRAADLAARDEPEAAVCVLVAHLVDGGTALDFVTNATVPSTIELLETVIEKLRREA